VLRCMFDKLRLRSADTIQVQVLSAYALFDVLDILGSHPTTHQVADELLAAHTRHMKLHREAYPNYDLIPKWHFAYHIPEQIKQHRHLLGTFVHERKHKTFKVHAAHYTNTSSFEKSMAKALLNNQLHFAIKDTSFLEGDFLVQGQEDNTDFAEVFRDFGDKVFLATRCVHGEVGLASGDVVLCKGDADSPCVVKAELFVRIEDHLRGDSHLLVGCPFSRLPNDIWAPSEEVIHIAFDRIVRPLIWSHASQGIRVIMPLR